MIDSFMYPNLNAYCTTLLTFENKISFMEYAFVMIRYRKIVHDGGMKKWKVVQSGEGD